MAADITVQTPGGQVEYEGSARIDGAPGSSAPIEISFLDTAGSVCSGRLPTGKPRDTVTVTGEGFEDFTLDVTCIDNGMPLVIFKAADVGATGLETVAELNADTDLKRRIEALRLQISRTIDRKSTRLNSSHTVISYAVFCMKNKRHTRLATHAALRQCNIAEPRPCGLDHAIDGR